MNENNQSILITGATGFVGSRLVGFLSSQFPEMELRLALRRRPEELQVPSVLSVGSIEVVSDINPYTNWSNALIGVDSSDSSGGSGARHERSGSRPT